MAPPKLYRWQFRLCSRRHDACCGLLGNEYVGVLKPLFEAGIGNRRALLPARAAMCPVLRNAFTAQMSSRGVADGIKR